MINNQAQRKLERTDLSEVKLLKDAFSLNPAPPGVRPSMLGEDDGNDTLKNRQLGEAGMDAACYNGIRNPASHDVMDELPEHEALEQLAAFSILARWVDEATVTMGG